MDIQYTKYWVFLYFSLNSITVRKKYDSGFGLGSTVAPVKDVARGYAATAQAQRESLLKEQALIEKKSAKQQQQRKIR